MAPRIQRTTSGKIRRWIESLREQGRIANRTRRVAKLTLFSEKRFVADLAEDLIEFVRKGKALLADGQAWVAHLQFGAWTEEVSKKTRNVCSSELALEWESFPSSPLGKFGTGEADWPSWEKFRSIVEARCDWLGQLPSRIAAAPERVQSSALAAGRREVEFGAKSRAFVDPKRIEELKQVRNSKFDLSRLVRLCEEINMSFATECHFSVAMLTRAILDHVSPIFGFDSFTEVANNYAGAKSFKESMQTLDNSSRKIADQHLHTRIREAEVLPNATQVDFSQPLDVLLAEIVRLHKRA
jgi:hypothetical protein